MPTERLGWHFLRNGTLGYGDGRKPRAGQWLRANDRMPIILATNGMHAAKHPLDAYLSAPFCFAPAWDEEKYELCRVQVRGELRGYEIGRFAGRERRIISRIDAKPILKRLFRRMEQDVAMGWHKQPDELRRRARTWFNRLVRAEFKRQNKRLK
jgi:hypothetical protein